ncbi:glutamate--tRNA ligase [Candidatus Woesearchaeota archaeon]|nr:glutamate--tRNA ligase [Candidatus Woesearchaeota archaeon]
MQSLREDILKYALQNAISFNGKASQGPVLGKILKEKPELKKNVKELTAEISRIVNEVNKLEPEQQKERLEQIAPELLEKKKHAKRDLPELKNAEHGKVVTRIPPEPSKYLHIGHAISFMINYLYAKKYNGTCILRFEDTNPSTAKQEYIESMQNEITGYLQITPDKTIIVSNDMPKFYEYAEKLISERHAYSCQCDKDSIREMRQKGHECPCREKSSKQNMSEWKEMLAGKCGEGERILRLKADMQSPNHAMRDPALFRITYEEHYLHRKKYCVWPLYDFENAVEDGMHKVTHIMRSIEFGNMRVELQDTIKQLLGLPNQTVIQYGRFSITGSTTKGREIRELIQTKRYIGWHDPRLSTLAALRKRCIQPETYRELAIEVGLSTTQTNLDFSIIAAINRKLLDAKADRYFLIRAPEKATIEGAPSQTATLSNHPTQPERGTRQYHTETEFYLEKKDLESFQENELIRLMDCLNFRKKGKRLEYESATYEEFKGRGKRIIHWLPAEHVIKAQVMMPNAEKITVLAETETKNLNEGEIVQFTRFGFCRLENKEKMLFWYGHE